MGPLKYVLPICLFLSAWPLMAQEQVHATPVATPPPTAQTAPTQESGPAGFYYFCQSTSAYYPTVPTCNEGWIAIPVGAPPPVYHRQDFPTPWSEPESTESREMINSRTNVFSFELFGRALVYSLDYDKAISENLTLGAGISSWTESHHWGAYQATVTVLPLYANYYFSEKPARGYFSAGADLIKVTQSDYNNDNFNNNGGAAVIGGGFESREASGFLLRMGFYAIIGRSVDLSPSVTLGFAF